MSVSVTVVIRVERTRGRGIDAAPFRSTIEYWDFEGHLLATSDPILEQLIRGQVNPQLQSDEAVRVFAQHLWELTR